MLTTLVLGGYGNFGARIWRLLGGAAMRAGASACAGLIELPEFQPEFDRWGMVTDIVEEAP